MQLSSFLFATLALAISSAWAKPDASDDEPTCLRICRDDPVTCQAGWISTQVAAEGEEVCFHSIYNLY
ncbi:uncharacterized protein N7511_010349 [Penicillium nucicola]|uniref:uncharacterized protein n=1 Tax=Penicillium nucicola TaxID=1850975 RepID=UPI0025456F77|nr:uncharacterized protein N7511_010349 [Penicillium nucicola]KAJ5748653.1 hypothetical protein N7511_010349 [Penicillium nucicola]